METFWKEYTIILPERKEFVFDIQNKKTNCVFIQNYNITNVFAGLKPHSYEVEIPPSRTSIINRPFPIEYIYFYSKKQTPVTIVETVTQNPIASFIQQEVAKNVTIDTVNTIIQNTPLEICQKDAFRPQVRRTLVWPPYRHRTEFIYDLGSYGTPYIQLLLFSKLPTWYRPYLTAFSIFAFNENTRYIRLVSIRFPAPRRRRRRTRIPPEINIYSDNVKIFSINYYIAHLSIKNNAFRYISVIGSNMDFDKPAIVLPIR